MSISTHKTRLIATGIAVMSSLLLATPSFAKTTQWGAKTPVRQHTVRHAYAYVKPQANTKTVKYRKVKHQSPTRYNNAQKPHQDRSYHANHYGNGHNRDHARHSTNTNANRHGNDWKHAR